MVIKMFQIKLMAMLLFFSFACFAELVVVANNDASVQKLSSDQIYRIYLGKMKFLPDGSKVIPVDQRSGSAIRTKFYSDLIKKSETDMKSYWSRIIFTGQGNPPIQESDDNSVKELVAKNPNCIGYIDGSAVDKSVKVVYSMR